MNDKFARSAVALLLIFFGGPALGQSTVQTLRSIVAIPSTGNGDALPLIPDSSALPDTESNSVLPNKFNRDRTNTFELPNSRSDSTLPDEFDQRRLEVNGKDCLNVGGYTKKSAIINDNLYQHWIMAANSCGQYVKIRICYRGSADCLLMSVPPWGSKKAIFGISPEMTRFKYDIVELPRP